MKLRNGIAAQKVEGCFLEISITLTNNLNLNPVDHNLEPRHPIGQHHFKDILSSVCEILDTGPSLFFKS
jgi:hypothetical protein